MPLTSVTKRVVARQSFSRESLSPKLNVARVSSGSRRKSLRRVHDNEISLYNRRKRLSRDRECRVRYQKS